MWKVIFILLFVTENLSDIQAQTKAGLLRGRVWDSLGKTPLALANILVYKIKDSNDKKETLSNRNGYFEINNISTNDSILLKIRFNGYNGYEQKLSLDGRLLLDLGEISLRVAIKELEAVVVKGQAQPILLKKDTVEFNAASFKTWPNAVIMDLLRKLPGLSIDPGGFLIFNGRRISKILVDGKDFFAGDSLAVLNNLPAELVSKIQLVDSRTIEQVFHDQRISGGSKTINIKLKKVSKNLFGHLVAGAGTENRYDLGGMLNHFNGTKKLSLIASSNNINKIGFGSGGDWGIINPGNGITDSKLAGLNWQGELNDQTEANGSYFFNRANTSNESMINRKQIVVSDSTFSTFAKTNQDDNIIGNRVQFTINYQPDSANTLNIVSAFNSEHLSKHMESYSFAETSIGEKINSNNRKNIIESNEDNYSLKLFWGRKLKKAGRLFSFSFYGFRQFNKTKTNNQSKDTIYTNGNPDSAKTVKQQILNDMNTNAYHASVVYTEPISSSIKFIVNENLDVNPSKFRKNTYQLDTNSSTVRLDSIYSGWFNFNTIASSTNVVASYNSQRWELTAGATIFLNQLNSYSDFAKTGLQRVQWNYLPIVGINWHFNKKENARFNYSAYVQQPDAMQLQPIPDNSNPFDIKVGNPNLKPSLFQYYSLNYFLFDGRTDIEAGVQYSRYKNKVINAITYDNYGRQISQFINVNGGYGVNGNFMFSRIAKKERISKSASISMNIDYNNDLTMVNNQLIVSKTLMLSPIITAEYSYNNWLTINFNYRFSYVKVSYNTTIEQQVNYILQTFFSNIDLYLFKSIRMTNELKYLYNSNTAPGFNHSSILWNIGFASYFLSTKNLQAKLTIYDLFKANNNFQRTATSNYIENSQSAVLRQYFMLSLGYYFNSQSKKIRSVE